MMHTVVRALRVIGILISHDEPGSPAVLPRVRKQGPRHSDILIHGYVPRMRGSYLAYISIHHCTSAAWDFFCVENSK